MSNNQRLVLFDFDGTITTKDTLFEFTRFAVGDRRFFTGLFLLTVPMGLTRAGILSGQRAKEIFLSYFFRNTSVDEFRNYCKRFAMEKLPHIIRPLASRAIESYKHQGNRMIIVSASPEEWISPWATALGIEVIATRLQIKDGKLTGLIDGKNCNGSEKVVRIKESVVLTDYHEVIAFGDTKGDIPMLNLATSQHYRPFREE
jgi:HAD superfamily hydrolase (TIGR01490 family)